MKVLELIGESIQIIAMELSSLSSRLHEVEIKLRSSAEYPTASSSQDDTPQNSSASDQS